jgi:predicted metal-binding membrane protein
MIKRVLHPAPVNWASELIQALRHLVEVRPDWWVFPLALLAWVVFPLLMGFAVHPGDGMNYSGMVMDESSMAMAPSGPGRATVVLALLFAWAAMVVAMMLPAAVPSIRYVAFASLRPRRSRAMVLFTLGFMLVWLPWATATLVWDLLRPPSLTLATTLGLGVAAMWELTRQKRRALQRCRRTIPIRVRGSAADRSCFGFGVLSGRRCLISCGPAMAAVVVSGHEPLVVALVAIGMFAQRITSRGEQLTGRTAVLLVVAAMTVVLV